MKDLYNDLKALDRITNQVITDTAKNTGDVDLQGYESAVIAVNLGVNGDTLDATNYVKVTVQHGDTTTTYTTVTAPDVLGATPASGVVVTDDGAADDDATYLVGYIGGKRYVKVTVTPIGTLTNGTPVSVDVFASHERHAPAN